ncbi:NAD(P)/FAD-dependent oxidoreductase [Terrabacter sp. Soil810]|uniref:FAD-dependent oxidoreductase n=1 Tax=Terrabacter sp. Soil810 TaxID=1736418 RepID=UPI00070C9A80|nr:FAD-dependent monooxygenase [Terrabacter sp. Soil810]KRF39385.1 pyridine nucleotide-disulfide oxidoreductase [Terrabacter sp. Soil810]
MKALVVGGGVAGPATALALHQVGIEATVLEAWPRSDGEAGSWFTLAPNGLHALDLLGARHLAAGIGFPSERNVMAGATGRVLGSMSLGVPLEDGTVAVTMKRSRLAAALLGEAERRGIEVCHASRVTEVASSSDGVTVNLEDGSTVAGDLLVGADGVRSMVRQAIDPHAAPARYVGLTNFGGITERTPLAATLPARQWHFVFGSRAFFGAHPTPDGDVVWFVNVPGPAITRAERAARTPEQWQDRLVELLADDAGPAADLVRTGRLELWADNTHDLPRVARWHRDRMVIVGDAAHAPSPSSGQGASLALEDAVVLATCLRDGGTVEEALTAYDTARRDRVERIVAAGARSSSSKIPGRTGRAVRDAMMRLVFRFVVTERSSAWITGHRVRWDPEAAPALPSGS